MNLTVKEFELMDASRRKASAFPLSFPVLVCVRAFQSLSSKLKQHLNIKKSLE